MAGDGRLRGQQATSNAMTLCVKHTTYHHLKERRSRARRLPQSVRRHDRRHRRARDPGRRRDGPARTASSASLASRAPSAPRSRPAGPLDILRHPRAHPSDEDDARDHRRHRAPVATRCIERALQDLLVGAAQDFDLYRIFGAFRDLAGGLVTAAPVFFAADHFGKQEQQVAARLGAVDAPSRCRRARAAGRVQRLARAGRRRVDLVPRFVDRARAAGREVLIPYCGDCRPLRGPGLPQPAGAHQRSRCRSTRASTSTSRR